MKTSLTKLSCSLLLISLPFTVWAKPVAQVLEVKGTVFMVTHEGKTTALKVNQHLEDKADVMVEEGASITLNDYYDATYHLIGGSHLKLFNQSVQLKKGKTWIESKNPKNKLALTTANGLVAFSKGEFIATFDHVTSRSQVLVVNGEVEVSNILDKNMKHAVSAGSFTMVDPEVENGLPRTPTKVGLTSLNAALSEFKHLPEKIKKTSAAPERTIASVAETTPSSVMKGEIIFMSSGERKPASVESSIAKKYFKKLKPKPTTQTPVQIRYFGTNFQKAESFVAPRSPASMIPKVAVMPQFKAGTTDIDPEFTQSLKKQVEEQPKYRKELQNLIDDLKSY